MRACLNGVEEHRARLLCRDRAQVGLAFKSLAPDRMHIYGKGWPEEADVVEDSRLLETERDGERFDWGLRKDEILVDYGFDLCWENTEVPGYASEKFWAPVRLGLLPLYWGPPEMHAQLPAESVIDCRAYRDDDTFRAADLLYDVLNLTETEYRRRVTVLLDWYESLPPDTWTRSLAEATRMLADEVLRLSRGSAAEEPAQRKALSFS